MRDSDSNQAKQRSEADALLGGSGGEDELFIVAGLGADAQDDLGDITADLPGALAPLDAAERALRAEIEENAPDGLARGMDEIYAFEDAGGKRGDFEEVELGAAAGELAAVEPPQEALEPALEEAAAVGTAALPEPVQIRERRFKPWMGIAAAAVLAIGVGWFALFGRSTPPDVEPPPVAIHTPPPAVAPTPAPAPVDPTCAPSAPSESTVAVADFAAPEVAEAAPVVDSPAYADGTEPEDPNATLLVRTLPPPSTAGPRDPAHEPVTPLEVLHAVGRGGDVVVHLRNGNFFHGRVDRFTDDSARLRVAKGEIGFTLREVESIIPAADEKTTSGPEAVVRLANGNRIAGRLGEERDGEVALVVGQARIKIPRATIARVELRPATGLMLGEPITR